MKKAYITGPTGAIGLALVDKLKNEDIDVTVIVRPNSERASRLVSEGVFDNTEIIECDLKDLKKLDNRQAGTVKRLSEGEECVFYHLGWMGTSGEARMDMKLQLRNVEYTIDAVELAARLNCGRFVGVGSQAEYGRCEGKLYNDTPCNPENGYGIAKLAAGRMSRIRAKQLGIEHVWTRVLSVYGKGDNENSLISSLIVNLANGREVHCTKGEQIWNYISSSDAAEYLYRLGNVESVDGKIFCVAGSESHTLKEYMELVRATVQKLYPDVNCPDIVYDRPYAEGQVMYLDADITELAKVCEYVPMCDFTEEIQSLIGRFRNEN